MQASDKQLTHLLTRALERIGVNVDDIAFEVPHRHARLDCLMHVSASFGHKLLAIELLGQAYPRDIRNVGWQLDSFLKDTEKPDDVILMVAAEYISDGAKEELRHHGLAYFEASGTFYLRHREWYIDIQRPSKPAGRRDAVQLFTDAREQVVLALLFAHNSFLSGLQLADISRTSTYTVSTVLAELERREWIESVGSGRTLRRKLSRPADLLDAWSEVWRQRKEPKTKWYFYTSVPNDMVGQLSSKLQASGIYDAVFSGAAAANEIEPHLTRTDIADIIIPPGEAERYAEALGLKSVEKGANVTLIERSGSSTLMTITHGRSGAQIANSFILYLDLLDGKGRNKELAAQLRQSQLKI